MEVPHGKVVGHMVMLIMHGSVAGTSWRRPRGRYALVRGILISESLKVGATLAGIPLALMSITRVEAGDEALGQPRIWTMIEFEAADHDAPALAQLLSQVIDRQLGWYCDFRTTSETFVVFGGKDFQYQRGDTAARAEVEEYAQSVGVPTTQLDWPE